MRATEAATMISKSKYAYFKRKRWNWRITKLKKKFGRAFIRMALYTICFKQFHILRWMTSKLILTKSYNPSIPVFQKSLTMPHIYHQRDTALRDIGNINCSTETVYAYFRSHFKIFDRTQHANGGSSKCECRKYKTALKLKSIFERRLSVCKGRILCGSWLRTWVTRIHLTNNSKCVTICWSMSFWRKNREKISFTPEYHKSVSGE